MSLDLRKFYDDCNANSIDYPRDQSLHGLIAKSCQTYATKTAVVCDDESLTFAQFDQAANQLAHYLIDQGVEHGDLVGVCCDRNLDMPVILNGILRTGAAYVPLDPDYPLDRLMYMAENGEIKHVVAHANQKRTVANFNCAATYFDEIVDELAQRSTRLPAVKIDPAVDVAYVIYTSGSTGKPKGVLVPHQSAVNLMFAFSQTPGFTENDKVLATTTLSFDISITEIFLPLFAGGQCVVVDRATAKDQDRLVEAVRKHNITFLQATPAHWRLICEADFIGSRELKFISGGEPLPRDLIGPMLDRCGELWNCYGPTEGTVWTSGQQIRDAHERILIGRPLANTTAYVVDRDNQLCPPETEGELLVGGDCVTLGYLKRGRLTAEKFIDFQGERVYRTGDLAKILETGEIEHLGRIDNQIKLHGHRIELGEIEAAIKLADPAHVRLAAAVVREDRPGDKRLVGYVLPYENKTVDLNQVKSLVEQKLPEYMVPSVLTCIEEFPYTPSGKVDRKSFPAPSRQRPDLATEFVPPKLENEIKLAELWQEILDLDEVGLDDNFFELGGNSIKAVHFVKRCGELLGSSLSNAEFFDKPTIRSIIDSDFNNSTGKASATIKQQTTRDSNRTGYAVIGMSVRLPGAANVGQFWDNLIHERESIRFFNQEELDSTLPTAQTKDPNYVSARGVIDGATEFDARFFNVPPREATLVDPQQRIMLELAWTALEDAGCIPSQFDGKIGVWAGTYETSYFTKNLLTHPEIVEQTGQFQLGVYNEKDYIATRVAHKLNLKGPAINVNTACSTSLVAIIEACNSLNGGLCDAAIAGGVSVHFPQNSGHLHQEGSIFSPDGHCRPFDSNAGGTLFSDGGGCVVLKRLDDAVKAGDHIYAVIKGFGMNNDGGDKASFSAPSIAGQADAVFMAHQHSQCDVETISYIEAHGTATPIGDPIEIAALCRAFGHNTNARQFCGIGSVKSNIGHTVAAAGVTGFVKTVLALKNETIPATLNYRQPNPQINFPETPFYVVSEQQDWPRTNHPRRAGVSSFGVGGTNAHIVLEEAPTRSRQADSPTAVQLLKISAQNETAVCEAADSLANEFRKRNHSLGEIAATLEYGREPFSHRAFVVAEDHTEAARLLESRKAPGFVCRKRDSIPRDVVFMFPGQGSQYVRMGQDLSQAFPVFKESIGLCSEILRPLIGRDLRQVLFPESGDESAAAEILKATQYTQPALFSLGYALARTLFDLGIRPTAMIGHSIGEFAAACVAGVFSLEDGLTMIAKRGELMQALPRGSMLSVRRSGQDVEALIRGNVEIASYNGPQLCVVAGPSDEMGKFREMLEKSEIACKPLLTSHAFHSSMMNSIVEPFRKFIANTRLDPPQIPILSTVTGKWMTDRQATDPLYWAEHLRLPVRFSDAVEELWSEDPNRALVELGPRKTLSTLAMQHATDRKQQLAIPTMSATHENHAEQRALLTAIGFLWTAGVSCNMSRLLPQDASKVSLPTYSFQRKKFFVKPIPPHQSRFMTLDANQGELTRSEQNNETVDSPRSILHPPIDKKTMSRLPKIVEQLNVVFAETSGFDLGEFDKDTTFFEMGLDSLVLTQTATALKRKFEIEISFRQLLEETTTVDSLANYLDAHLPGDTFLAERQPEDPSPAVSAESNTAVTQGDLCQAVPPANEVATVNQATVGPMSSIQLNVETDSGTRAIINNQLQIMAAQLELLGGGSISNSRMESITPPESNPANTPRVDQGRNSKTNSSIASVAKSNSVTPKKAFGAAARVSLASGELDENQQAKLQEIVRETQIKMPSSKAYAQRHRQYMADPRTVSGFTPATKEMTFPIVVEKSKGVHLYDLDGNQYIDYTCGFGSNFLGHTTDLVNNAIRSQLSKDYSIGPQSPLAGEVAQMFCELTGNERMAFSNTGSEAVLGCTRLARTYTGKQKIAMFTGDYHGILDEVIVRGNKTLKSFPAATGIPREHVDNTLILEYGTPESLEIIRDQLDDLAAVVVETVQSRKPELQPKEFLHELRELTEHVDTALIFDEVITGFRIAPGGAQQYFGVCADLASYGKVVGGGMPIGLIGGRAKYMDGLDGGFWQFGDNSRPEAGMTYFAGTFVRHPLALASAKAILSHIRSGGQAMYDRLNALSDKMAQQLNEMFDELGAPLFLANFGSLFKVQFKQELPYSELIFAKLRLKGFFIWDHRPCLLNVQHTQQHVDALVKAFREVIIELQRAGLVPGEGYKAVRTEPVFDPEVQPCEGAKLGKDREGNPGWFVADEQNPGQFIQLSQAN